MIREVTSADYRSIAEIYNGYVLGSTATFETEPVSVEEMSRRIKSISSTYPYYVYELNGELAGYCYAHAWKERAAYSQTLETTIYLSPAHQGKGIGKQLMLRLIADCRSRGYHALIACITAENQRSRRFHEKLGFRQVSLFQEVGKKFSRPLDVADYELLLDMCKSYHPILPLCS